MQPSLDDSTNSIKAIFKQGDGTGIRAAYLPVTPDIMLVSQAKGRELVLRGVALHQQDATDQEGSLPPPPPANEFRHYNITIISIRLEYHESIMTKHDTFCLFCKIVINKAIMIAISLSNRSCPYEFNALIDFSLKTTSPVDFIAPSTVSTTQNAKLLPNLCHSLMLCHVTRSQHVGECETL